MNRVEEIILKGMRKACQNFFAPPPTPICENNPTKVSDLIYRLLIRDEPCMIARFGSTELSCLVNYLGIMDHNPSVWKYISNKRPQWWWNKNIMLQMQRWSGFFPPTVEMLSQFCEMMLTDMQQLDLLGSWMHEERYFDNYLQGVKKVKLLCLEPYWSMQPWSRVLEGKRVLVVHPFAEDIILQYNNHRELLFEDKRVLPKFSSLRVVKAVQSLGGESNGFRDWFEALECMKKEMDKEPYEIALVGCGAYGFPLAAHAKRTGHKAVHLGGALQLLFGIKGKRWTNIEYAKKWGMSPHDMYLNMFSRKGWIYPGEKSRPQFADNVEGGCYW